MEDLVRLTDQYVAQKEATRKLLRLDRHEMAGLSS
jgi:hypothetical protein